MPLFSMPGKAEFSSATIDNVGSQGYYDINKPARDQVSKRERRKEMKRLLGIVIMAFMLLGLFEAVPAKLGVKGEDSMVYAASKSYERINFLNGTEENKGRVEAGGKYFYGKKYDMKGGYYGVKLYCAGTKDGKGTLLAKGALENVILTDGNTVYYVRTNYDKGKVYLHKVNVNGKGQQQVKVLSKAIAAWNPLYLNGGKLFLKSENDSGTKLYALDLKTKKQTKLIVSTLVVEGEVWGPLTYNSDENYIYTKFDKKAGKNLLKIYNMKTGKVKTVASGGNFELIENNGSTVITSRKALDVKDNENKNYEIRIFKVTGDSDVIKEVDKFTAMNFFPWGFDDLREPEEIVALRTTFKGKAFDGETKLYDWAVSLRDINSKEEKLLYEAKGAEDVWTYYDYNGKGKYDFVYFGIEPVKGYKYDEAYTANLCNATIYGIRLSDMSKEKILELKDVIDPRVVTDAFLLNSWVKTEKVKLDGPFVVYLEVKPQGKNTVETYKAVNLYNTSENYGYEELYTVDGNTGVGR